MEEVVDTAHLHCKRDARVRMFNFELHELNWDLSMFTIRPRKARALAHEDNEDNNF